MPPKTSSQNNNLEKIRHSLSHLLAIAVLESLPKTKLGIGPVIDNGFYYDFDLSANNSITLNKENKQTINENTLVSLEKRIKELIKENLKFKKEYIDFKQAKQLFKDQPYKLELIEKLEQEKNKKITIYKTIHPKTKKVIFLDLCSGPHINSTQSINPEAFRLTKISGAYWQGNEKNPMLTRIYGIAFSSEKELAEYIQKIAEAEKRDHKKLGLELDLFTFSELVGSGLPLWTPRGTILRNLLDDFVWELRKKYNYERVDIPHITKSDLYQKSGHWDKFKEDLFTIKTKDGHIFALKPMNCPHHIQIYNRKKWSYRALPQRYASTTKVYRDEQSGELHGLSRVRSITQDDAHIFCRLQQIKDEVVKIWDIINIFYRTFNFTNITTRISTRDPQHPEKYLGDKTKWHFAESILKKIAKEKGIAIIPGAGEAAFYGPKLDFLINDSLGRQWQVATIQLDINMPEKFNLTCINEKGELENIVMIHTAIMGSIERFLSILIEHLAGYFPLWLAPIQITVINVGEKHKNYAQAIAQTLINYNFRVSLTNEDLTVGKRIREAELQKIPYIIVVGDRELKRKTINVRYSKKEQEMSLKRFIKKIQQEIAEKTI
jgi:threonyl-tRNA synthetase